MLLPFLAYKLFAAGACEVKMISCGEGTVDEEYTREMYRKVFKCRAASGGEVERSRLG